MVIIPRNSQIICNHNVWATGIQSLLKKRSMSRPIKSRLKIVPHFSRLRFRKSNPIVATRLTRKLAVPIERDVTLLRPVFKTSHDPTPNFAWIVKVTPNDTKDSPTKKKRLRQKCLRTEHLICTALPHSQTLARSVLL